MVDVQSSLDLRSIECSYILETTLNTPISEGGTNWSHTHNVAKSQSYQKFTLLGSDAEFIKTVNSIFIYHYF